MWDGATAFLNVAPNSYVVRTHWTDIDGVDRWLIGEGDVGELWTGSSVGPTVDGRIGVDVSAPGDRIVAAYAPRSYWASFRWNLIVDGGGLYGMAGAVSAAAPVVTGIIALMLEVDPTLDAGSVKRILQETARADGFTGRTPNPLWGHGKVDAYEALKAVRLTATS
jgi:subtilisin family serine protease